MRHYVVDGKPLVTRKQAGSKFWTITPVDPVKLVEPDQITCKIGPDGELCGNEKRLAQLNALQLAYASGEYESFEANYNELELCERLATRMGEEQPSRVVRELDWASESLASL